MAGRRHLILGMLCLVSGGGAACATGVRRPTPVTPTEIPTLEAQARREPRDARVRYRLAAGLMAAERCDSAVQVVRAAQALAPGEPLAAMIVGGCQERAGRHDLAYATYTDFARRYPRARGVGAVRGAAQLALRTHAVATARAALARESTLTTQPPEAATLAVLPLTIAGDSSFQPLSRGLAELLTTDLALVRTLRLLERVQIGALLDELRLGQSDRANPSTAARVGRLLRAERMVQGDAAITANGPVRLTAAVVSVDGTVRTGAQASGTFRQLLDLEKQLVFGIAGQLGVLLTEAERQRILREGPRNLAAFLAYSEGLEAMDRGDYRSATRAFSAAVQADPGFQAAREQQQAAAAAPLVQASAPGDLVTVVEAVAELTSATEPGSGDALAASILDVSPSVGDITSTGTSTILAQPTPESQGVSSIVDASGLLRIIFRRP